MIDLEGLEKLRAEGTAGEWVYQILEHHIDLAGVGPKDGEIAAYIEIGHILIDGHPQYAPEDYANAALIVAAVNALPELIAMARRVEADAACYASTSAAAQNVIDGLKAENERLRGAFYVNENGVERMLRFLAEAGHRVDPIVMSSAVGLYLETIARTALKEKPQ